LPRDLTVGVSFVTGSSEIVKGGGRVVKNVAGFDLVRLTIGAWGTLGVITEATVRLRARPEADETFVLALPAERDALATLLSTIRVAAVEPLAAELLSPVCANRIGLGSQASMLVRLAGNTTGVHHQRATLAKLASCEPISNDVWLKLRQSDPAGGVVVRVSRRPSELARLWAVALTFPDVDAHATLARGTVRLRLTRDTPLDAFDASDRRVFETGAHDPVNAQSDAISHRLRDAFDPARILNRGILGEDAQ
jgi:glycolate oxidase FAD binding subunit